MYVSHQEVSVLAGAPREYARAISEQKYMYWATAHPVNTKGTQQGKEEGQTRLALPVLHTL